MKSTDKLYKFHVANLRSVQDTKEQIARSLRIFIAKGDTTSTSLFLRLYALLMGAWAETRLKKLLFEPQGFTDDERNKIISIKVQIDQWKETINIAFRKHYNVKKGILSNKTLPHSAFARYTSILEMLNNDLRNIIELRNKLAHGQWEYPLNNEGNDVAQEQKKALNTENLLSLQFKEELISHLSDIVHNLVVSKPTFERDFDKYFKAIEDTRRNLENRDYNDYVSQLQMRYKRGRAKIIANKNC